EHVGARDLDGAHIADTAALWPRHASLGALLAGIGSRRRKRVARLQSRAACRRQMRLRRSSVVSQWPQLRIDIEEIRRNVRRNYASVRIANQIVLTVAAQLPHAIVRPGAAMVPGDNAVFEHGNLTGRGLDSAPTETPRVVPYTGVVCDGYVIENRKTVLRETPPVPAPGDLATLPL